MWEKCDNKWKVRRFWGNVSKGERALSSDQDRFRPKTLKSVSPNQKKKNSNIIECNWSAKFQCEWVRLLKLTEPKRNWPIKIIRLIGQSDFNRNFNRENVSVVFFFIFDLNTVGCYGPSNSRMLSGIPHSNELRSLRKNLRKLNKWIIDTT